MPEDVQKCKTQTEVAYRHETEKGVAQGLRGKGVCVYNAIVKKLIVNIIIKICKM